MFSATRIAAALALSCAAIGAQAHSVWMKPSSTVLSKADWVTVDAAVSNDMFFFNHRPLGLDKLVITAPDGSTVEPKNAHKGELRSVFDIKPEQAGTYQLAIVNSGVMGSYKDAAGQMKRLRGSAEEIAKQIPADAKDVRVAESISRIETFVTMGKPSPLRLSGKGLELVPVTHPNDLVVGEEATFAFHVDGKPAADVEVVLVPDGKRYRDAVNEIKLKTDAQGHVKVKFPTAGMYWLDADVKDDKTSNPIAKERRLAYVATLEVLP
ncbi:DUF4198 domain-containing protein [Comamonas sp. JUb58]|uniref:DUF4198 domain-containing protein n=1 Tax=Comamonas sp. JUb58 TaxID=2485114 RepID=UPI00105ECF3F|nr:DUF4198 domain-containing protein [Comamonas sp. JUb58]TDS85253.1 putative GH25 family protein [Comamonas sp. JUb58]